MTPAGQAAVLVAITLVCGALVAGCGNGVRTEGDAPRATPSSSAPAPTDLPDLRKLVDDAESAAAAADSDAAADH
ncbi:hypothetical protein AB0G60_01330 [Streptomyces angustmyceticus]|uniref:Uncharacterized protein n=1 Tax=Streptomyces angustmyceticus TaxID=285578 RepID=A0A5J4L1D0_9ACTN|nr:hypothetical protein [Streptomyces angustmyceticus]UAL65327.1 hypothetical protein K7396_01325 [Streptomyces angustmyceticus]GES28187.1 hypothetical protein San01_06740 [Streptomyces angustmyceticus]